jgi:hypothetical protein
MRFARMTSSFLVKESFVSLLRTRVPRELADALIRKQHAPGPRG